MSTSEWLNFQIQALQKNEFFKIDFLTISDVLYFLNFNIDKPVSLREVNRSQTSKFLYIFSFNGLSNRSLSLNLIKFFNIKILKTRLFSKNQNEKRDQLQVKRKIRGGSKKFLSQNFLYQKSPFRRGQTQEKFVWDE